MHTLISVILAAALVAPHSGKAPHRKDPAPDAANKAFASIHVVGKQKHIIVKKKPTVRQADSLQ